MLNLAASALLCWLQPARKPDTKSYTEYCYWAGYYWKIWYENELGNLGLFAMPAVCHNGLGHVANDDKLPGVQVGGDDAQLIPSNACPQPIMICLVCRSVIPFGFAPPTAPLIYMQSTETHLCGPAAALVVVASL